MCKYLIAFSIAFLFNLFKSYSIGPTTNVSPAYGSSSNAVSVTLDWSSVSGNAGYLFEIDTTPNFNSPVHLLASTATNSSQTTVNDLFFGTTYYWRSAVKSTVDTSAWTTVWFFTTINKINLVSPAGNSINQPVSVTLDWDAITGNNGYIFEIDSTPNFNSPLHLLSSTAVNSSQTTINDLRFGTKYYWRAACKNNADTSDWSVVFNFTTINTIGLVSPANNATNQQVSLTLDWDAVTGNNGYLYEIDTTINFNSPLHVLSNSAVNSSQITINDLHFNTTYYWRAACKNNADTSDWSTIYHFTTINTIGLVSPANGSTNQPVSVTLDWDAVTGNNGYLYEIDTTINFNSPLHVLSNSAVNSSQITINDLHFNTTYYWRAASKNNADTSNWSVIYSFTNINTIGLVSPNNGSLNQFVSVTLDWDALTGNNGYLYEIDTTIQFNSTQHILSNSAVNSSQITVNDLLFGTKYYWRSAVKNNADTSDWSVVYNFTTGDSTSHVSPANNAINQSVSSLTLDWNAFGGNTGYIYQYDQYPSFDSPYLVQGSTSTNTSQVTITGLQSGATYYWRVAIKDSADTSMWTNAWKFNTAFVMTQAPTLISPSDLSNNIATSGETFSWTSVANASYYEIQYCKNSSFNAIINYKFVFNGLDTVLNNLQYNTSYYWRVRGKNSSGNSPWSSVWLFNTENCTLNSTPSITECENYNFNGTILTSSGNYTDTISSSLGCDSIINLNLTILEPVHTTITDSICNGSIYQFGSQNLSSGGIYYQYLNAANGCDSIVTLTLNVISKPQILSQSGNVYSCGDTDASFWVESPGNNTYQWAYSAVGYADSAIIGGTSNEINYNTDSMSIIGLESSGYYGFSVSCIITNEFGCTSISEKDTIFAKLITHTNETICQGTPYLFNGNFLSNSGEYIGNFISVNNCDSIVYLNLTVNETNQVTDYKSACNSYTWIDGNTYTQNNNTATFTYTNSNGCDSIITLNLIIYQTINTTDIISSCNSYTWIDGNTYTSSNDTATYTYTSIDGCDSVVTLNLTINYSDHVTDHVVAFQSYIWIDGFTYTSNNNTATYLLQNAAECDSIIHLDLIITNVAGDSNGDGVINNNEISGDINLDGNIGIGEITGDINGDGSINIGEIAGDINGDGKIGNGETTGDINGDGSIGSGEIFGDINGNGVLDPFEITSTPTLSVNSLKVFPNPFSNNIQLNGIKTTTKLEVTNIVGEIIYQNNINQNFLIDCNNWPKGNYILKTIENNFESNFRLIKE